MSSTTSYQEDGDKITMPYEKMIDSVMGATVGIVAIKTGEKIMNKAMSHKKGKKKKGLLL